MKISATEEYGLRCLLRVAEANHPVTANWVAEQEGISLAYAQKLLRQLSSEGILQAKRGAGGGFHLSRPATSISVGDAMRAFGTMVDVPSFCEKHTGERETCTRAESCSIQSVWTHILSVMMRTLDCLPLSALLGSPEAVTAELESIVQIPTSMFCPIAPTSAEGVSS